MNILPHKSWHVRTKRNIERVRRDEAQARADQEETQRRVLLAEQEARTQLLRNKARSENSSTVTQHFVPGSSSPKHVNIFEGAEDSKDNKNVEHEQELKQEKEKWEKKIGLLQVLASKDDEETHRPWYLMSHEVRMKLNDDDANKNIVDQSKEMKQIKVKKFHDPLEDMKKYLDVMKHNKGETNKQTNKETNKTTKKDGDNRVSKRHHEKKKKRKHKRRRHSSDSSTSSESSGNEPKQRQTKSLEELRAERLKREKEERERTRQLLLSREQSKSEYTIIDERQRVYNSQFNPQFARQNSKN